MKYLLDTCTVSDFVKGQSGVLAHVKATLPDQIVVTSITRMEIDYGLALNNDNRVNLTTDRHADNEMRVW